MSKALAMQATLDAVSSPVRREILWLTWSDELAVGDIGERFDLSGPTLSSHLAALRRAGLVSMRADGNFRRYRANQDAVRALVPLFASSDDRWIAANDLPERERASVRRSIAVTTAVEVSLSPSAAFDAFADGDRYSEWLGVPVHIRGRSFRATLEWGTQVRGTYDVVSAPDLIAMRWDFDDDAVPVPGRELIAYLRVTATRAGCRVEVVQLADDDMQASFLTQAWATVLGRFAEANTSRRPVRPKRQ